MPRRGVCTKSEALDRTTSVFVGGLSNRVTERNLFQIFNKVGTTRKVQYFWHHYGKNQGLPRRFAFIELSSPEEKQRAIDKFDGRVLGGRKLQVEPMKQIDWVQHHNDYLIRQKRAKDKARIQREEYTKNLLGRIEKEQRVLESKGRKRKRAIEDAVTQEFISELEKDGVLQELTELPAKRAKTNGDSDELATTTTSTTTATGDVESTGSSAEGGVPIPTTTTTTSTTPTSVATDTITTTTNTQSLAEGGEGRESTEPPGASGGSGGLSTTTIGAFLRSETFHTSTDKKAKKKKKGGVIRLGSGVRIKVKKKRAGD